ncbi:MAG: replication factor C large subunit [Candidatus Bathyarchaeia archaeon]
MRPAEQLDEKYKPSRISEIVGNREAIDRLVEWVRKWGKDPKAKRAVLIYGPPGSGKTVAVEALARELGLDLIEVNASDDRSKGRLERIVGGAASGTSILGKGRIVFLDEVDGISPSMDSGAMDYIDELLSKANYPVILAANNAWDPKLARIREKCELIEFKRIGIREAVPFLKKVAEKEGIRADPEALKLLAERNKGDLRAMLKDLQMLSYPSGILTSEDVKMASRRDRTDLIFNVLKNIFSAKSCYSAKIAMNEADLDPEMLFEWIYENAPLWLSDPSDLANGMEALAKADLFFNIAKREQNWSLISYAIDLMTAGVAMAKERSKAGWVPMKFPERIALMAKTRSERGMRQKVLDKIARRCHLSRASANASVLPYIIEMAKNDAKAFQGLSEWFGFNAEEVEFLKSLCGASARQRPRRA